jgi:hypothetical protein
MCRTWHAHAATPACQHSVVLITCTIFLQQQHTPCLCHHGGCSLPAACMQSLVVHACRTPGRMRIMLSATSPWLTVKSCGITQTLQQQPILAADIRSGYIQQHRMHTAQYTQQVNLQLDIHMTGFREHMRAGFVQTQIKPRQMPECSRVACRQGRVPRPMCFPPSNRPINDQDLSLEAKSSLHHKTGV